jgi:bifunctional lysine-specific demethylase and histidyl-hydroxylase NO66
MAQELSLDWLLAPVTLDAFLNEIWGVTHYHVNRGRPDYLNRLCEGAGNVDELLAAYRPHLSLVSLVRKAERKEQYLYRLADGSFDVAAIGQDFADGYSIVLESVQRYVRPLAELSQSIDVELNFAAQVNAYFTPPQSQGLVAHFDDHDALIVQLQGSKIWHLYEGIDVPPHEMAGHPPIAAAELPAPVDVRLETGDVLYVPRGRVHAAESAVELSVHLTVGLHAPTLSLLATRILNALSSSEDLLHTQLPPRFLSDPGARTGLGGLVRGIADILGRPDAIAGGLDSLEADLVGRGLCQPPRSGISDAVAIDDATWVMKVQPLYARVTESGDAVTLHFAKSAVTSPSDHRGALHYVAKSAEPFRISELPGLSDAQRIDLARTLILQGFLLRLPGD